MGNLWAQTGIDGKNRECGFAQRNYVIETFHFISDFNSDWFRWFVWLDDSQVRIMVTQDTPLAVCPEPSYSDHHQRDILDSPSKTRRIVFTLEGTRSSSADLLIP